MLFPFVSETGTKVQCHVSSCQLSGKARPGHSLTVRATLCYSSLTPSPWLTIRLTSALPRPSCILQCFCQILRAKQRCLASAAKLPPVVSGGGEQEHENKTGCSERDGHVSSSQVFCWKKAAKHRSFSFASLTDTEESFPALCFHVPR